MSYKSTSAQTSHMTSLDENLHADAPDHWGTNVTIAELSAGSIPKNLILEPVMR